MFLAILFQGPHRGHRKYKSSNFKGKKKPQNQKNSFGLSTPLQKAHLSEWKCDLKSFVLIPINVIISLSTQNRVMTEEKFSALGKHRECICLQSPDRCPLGLSTQLQPQGPALHKNPGRQQSVRLSAGSRGLRQGSLCSQAAGTGCSTQPSVWSLLAKDPATFPRPKQQLQLALPHQAPRWLGSSRSQMLLPPPPSSF